jgi:hypothetical protein
VFWSGAEPRSDLAERGAEALYRVLGSDRIRQPGAAGDRSGQSTFHCSGTERSLHLGCAWESFGVLGSAAASLLSIARWNGPGIEAAMPDRMGSPKNVAAIVIITTDTRTMSTSLTMRLENCFVIIEPSRPIMGVHSTIELVCEWVCERSSPHVADHPLIVPR